MPLAFKQEKHSTKTRKPLSSSTNTKDSISRKQKSYTKKEQFKQPQKIINRSTTNIKTINTEVQERHNKKSNLSHFDEKAKIKYFYQEQQSSQKTIQLSLKGKQSSAKLKQSWGKLKQSAKQVYFYDKYSKKDIVNISIIQEKSLLSNNQQNSLDSLNNFIIEGNNDDKSLLQKSHQSSSFDDEEEEDWTLMQRDYQKIVEQDQETLRENEYLRIMGLYEKNQYQNEQNSEQASSPQMNIHGQIEKLKEQIRKLKQLKNTKENLIEESSQVITQIVSQNSKKFQKGVGENSGSSEHVRNYDGSNGQSSVILQKGPGSVQFDNNKSLGLEMQRSQGQLKNSVENAKVQAKYNEPKKSKTSEINKQKQNHLLQQLIEQQNNDQKREQQQEINDEIVQQQKSLLIQQQEQFQNQSILQDQKSQQEFIRYMDKEYLQKKQSEDNQPNLSLNNISNIMRIKPLQLHNKSIENEHEIKQKQDDEVVAMLENQLRGKQSKLKTRSHTNNNSLHQHTNNLFLKQENLLQLKQEDQQSILKQDNEIILKDDNEIILMKQSRDNLCLNESDYQTNLQTEQSNDQNNNIFFALNARQKWIQSLDKDQQWKVNELALIAKMKKILHNPYIEFQDY